MKAVIKPVLAGFVFATLSSAAFAQVTPVVPGTPMQPSCLVGEQFVNGQCQPITGSNRMNNVDQLENSRSGPESTGSVGGNPNRNETNSSGGTNSNSQD